MNILLTFTDFHDPYASSVVEGQRQGGPILTVLAHRKIDSIVLFSTPGTKENTESGILFLDEIGELNHPNKKLLEVQEPFLEKVPGRRRQRW